MVDLRKHDLDLRELRHYYSVILNCMPFLVYWIDEHCVLQGCNARFSQLLNLNHIQDFSGTPYRKIAAATQWSTTDLDEFKLDDMAVIFSGQAKHNQPLKPVRFADGSLHHFSCNRDPLLDQSGKVIGAVVVLIEVEEEIVTEPQRIVKRPLLAYPPRVLIVEDNLVAKQVEEALLVALNCMVDCADNGEQALALFEPGKYDLVIMDIGLEDTSGYVLSKHFRQCEKGTFFHVPIIALTSFQADKVKHDCEYYFMDGVISKPLTAEQADQIVQHYVYYENTIVNGLKFT